MAMSADRVNADTKSRIRINRLELAILELMMSDEFADLTLAEERITLSNLLHRSLLKTHRPRSKRDVTDSE